VIYTGIPRCKIPKVNHNITGRIRGKRSKSTLYSLNSLQAGQRITRTDHQVKGRKSTRALNKVQPRKIRFTSVCFVFVEHSIGRFRAYRQFFPDNNINKTPRIWWNLVDANAQQSLVNVWNCFVWSGTSAAPLTGNLRNSLFGQLFGSFRVERQCCRYHFIYKQF